MVSANTNSIEEDSALKYNDYYDSFTQTVPDERWSGIKGGSSKSVMFKLLSGLLNQDKYLPIRYCPIQIEIEVVSSPNDPILSEAISTIVDATTISTSWSISDVQIKADIIELDTELQNSYASHLLSGKSLPINYSSYISQIQVASGPTSSLYISRALTKLKTVFMTFSGNNVADVARPLFKSWNLFYHPEYHTGANVIYNPNYELVFK